MSNFAKVAAERTALRNSVIGIPFCQVRLSTTPSRQLELKTLKINIELKYDNELSNQAEAR